MAAAPVFRFSTVQLQAGIRRLLEQDARLARAAMRDVAMLLIKAARDRAPIDEGNLANSITAEALPYRKSWAAVVYVPINSQAAQYAVPMHEGQYNLGKNSEAKQLKVGVTVGPGYLSRAVDDNKQKIMAMIAFKVRK